MNWIKIKFELDKIFITIEFDSNWFPPQLFDNYYLALHSPNYIPDFKIGQDFIEIKTSSWSKILFSKIIVDRSNDKYDTNCYDYINDNQLSSDCVSICILKSIQDKMNWFDSRLLMRKDYLKYIDEDIIKNDYSSRDYYYQYYFRKELLNNVKQDCLNQCKPNCHFSYYLYDISTDDYKALSTMKDSYVTIQHNRLPDLFVQHVPETSFISFISNFGGLLGMWLGINVLVIFSQIYSIGTKILDSMKNQQNNQLLFQTNYINPRIKMRNTYIRRYY